MWRESSYPPMASPHHKTSNEQSILDEQKLVEAAQKDLNRFAALYDKYHRQIFLFVYKRTFDEDISDDLVSVIFAKAMQSLGKFQFRGVPFSAWLYRIASNEVNQHFRSTKTTRNVSIDHAGIERMIAHHEESEDRSETDHQIKVLMSVLADLDESDLQLIELRFFEDLAFREVAFVLGITENNAKVRSHRILERLRVKLNGKLGGGK